MFCLSYLPTFTTAQTTLEELPEAQNCTNLQEVSIQEACENFMPDLDQQFRGDVFNNANAYWGENGTTDIASIKLLGYPLNSAGLRVVNNKNIIIEGVFIVDVGVVFNNCRFLMLENSRIVVKSGKTLKLFKSRLFGNQKMWQGIAAENGSILRFFYSRIEDAIFGVRTNWAPGPVPPGQSNKVSIWFNTDTLNCNHIGISNKFGPDMILPVFSGNVFSCSKALLPLPSNLDTPGMIADMKYSSILGFAAIELTNSNASFNTTLNLTRSKILNYRYGFYINGISNVQIKSIDFSCIEDVPNAPGGSSALGGTAIFAQAFGAANVQNCRFNGIEKNCVQVYSNNLVAKNNIFGYIFPTGFSSSSYRTGVRAEHLPGYLGTYNISDNSFLMAPKAPETGIAMQRPSLNTPLGINNVIINGNKFKRVTGGSGTVTPIDVSCITNNLNGNLLISRNLFEIAGQVPKAAINLTGSSTFMQENISITYNKILLESAALNTQLETGGIRIENVPSLKTSNLVANDTITTSGPSSLRSGIYIKKSPGFCYKQNRLDKSEYGIRMLGNNYPSSFSENVMVNHKYGMYFNNIGTMSAIDFGEQLHKGNVFTGPFSANGAWILPSIDNLSSNKFIIHSTASQFNTNPNVPNWFVNEDGILKPNCFQGVSAPISNPDLDIINNTTTPVLNPHQPWFASLNLLFRIHLLPEYQTPLYTNYASTMQGTSQNEFGKYMAAAVSLLEPDAGLSQQLLTAQTAVETLQAQIEILTNQLSPEGDSPQDANIMSQLDLLHTNLDAEAKKIAEAQLAQKIKHVAGVETLRGKHASLPETNLLEIVVKKILGTDLLREQGFSPYTQNIQSELYGIATSDANTVGEAALWAAQRLSGCFKDNYNRYFEAQQAASGPQLVQNKEKEQVSLLVYPNPTRDRFSCSIPDVNLVKLQLFSTTGALIATQTFPEGVAVAEFETLLLPESLYRVVATSSTGRIFSSNISVLR